MSVSANFSKRAVSGVRNLHPYQPGKPISELERELGLSHIVKLASNENPLGISARAKAAIEKALKEVTFYPDANGFYLKQALANLLHVAMEQITLGNGSNDVLDMLVRTFVEPGDQVVCAEHCFIAFPISAQAQGADITTVPAKDFGHDLPAMQAAVNEHTKLVYLVNPNNPTGTWLRERELKTFLQSLPSEVIVVYDEAYFEYACGTPEYPNAIKLLSEFPNLVVLRTFSKAYGLAALRLGFAVSNADIADLLNRVRQPFNCNSLALAAGVAVLEDKEYLDNAVEVNRAGLMQLADGLQKLGLSPIPSLGNFLCVDLQRPARPIYEALLKEGVIVRPIGNYGLPNHVRISVGLSEHNTRCLEALAKVLA
ncbi:histidinol-phosphate transaminase [Permianibacter aggregans]|nr:histidinol-phosphate transaminase [Permianibacter aggregans]QGX41309.1 histidinol-phosphate transaminase [Permianibacter aggregans]